jgi:hypothetical protein
MPYGPFAVSNQHDMLVLHPRAGGIISMTNHDARRQINLSGRLYAALAADSEWQPLPGVEAGTYKFLLPPGMGPAAVVTRTPAHAAQSMPAPEYGRYEVVLDGTVLMDGQEIAAPGFRYVRNDQAVAPIISGEYGATVAFLTFDRDALEGGIEGDGLGVAAAEAMARAI